MATVLIALAIYLALGLIVALPIVLVGVDQIDPVARDSPLAFRLLILPGAAALWPLMLARWKRASARTP